MALGCLIAIEYSYNREFLVVFSLGSGHEEHAEIRTLCKP